MANISFIGGPLDGLVGDYELHQDIQLFDYQTMMLVHYHRRADQLRYDYVASYYLPPHGANNAYRTNASSAAESLPDNSGPA